VWIDGTVVDAAAARVPVLDHGLLYGDGVFEGLRAFGRRVFRLDDHLARLRASAAAISHARPDEATLRGVVRDTQRALGLDDAYVRLVVTRGEGALGVDPASCPAPRVFCIAAEARIFAPETLAAGLALATVSWRRPGFDVIDPRVKSLNYLNNALAKLEARRAGADEALLLNAAGTIAEASVANVFVLAGRTLLTPPPTDGCLEGVTRRTVMEVAPSLGLAAAERTLSRTDLLAADEVFLTGTGAGIVPVRALDGQPIGAGAPFVTTEKLRAAYLARTKVLGVPF
jgi:branched-chain amino acid aminotransferase